MNIKEIRMNALDKVVTVVMQVCLVVVSISGTAWLLQLMWGA